MSNFCPDCQNILRAVDQLFTDGRIDDFVEECYVSNPFVGGVRGWTKAAKEGTCDLCFITYFHFEHELMTKILSETFQDAGLTWLLDWHPGDWAQLSLKCETGQYVGTELKALGGEKGSSTWGPRTAKTMRDWLHECISSHHECSSFSNFAFPMRLLDVNPAGTRAAVPITVDDINNLSINALPQVNLCSTNDLPSDTKYLTLSHCWGTEVSIRLSNKLLGTYENQIPLEDLLSPEAKVFREAIWITRCLGYRYLWIDALCINQDDDDEKSAEISRMDQIFSGAEANLSAASASSGADGMIFNRKHSLYELFLCEWKTGAPGRVHGGKFQEKKDYLVVKVPRENIDKEPVNKRAWVFQERILAPRVIHFCRNSIHRECIREYTEELLDYSPWVTVQQGFSSPHINDAPYDSKEGFNGIKPEKKDWCYRFRILLQRYSPTLLTFPQDRLASFAGIAKRISINGGLDEDEYFAGLWEPDLPRALLWHARNHFGERKWDPERIGYISPSWSWAGCEAPMILYGREHLYSWENLVEVIHVWTVPLIPKGSLFGALSDGGMTLKGRLVEVHRKRIGDAFLVSVRDEDSNFENELYLEVRPSQTIAEFENHSEGGMKEVNILWDRFAKARERVKLPAQPIDASLDLSSWDKIEPEVLYFLPIGQGPTREVYRKEDSLTMEGLVLCRDDTTGKFRRVGTFETCPPYPVGANRELRLRLLNVPETDLTIV
ncbi:heterokaryon incompatibility protein [Fusarium flagelliforme]|uniref:Heterokaryon incompatibility protein n=1 Tax=Fusarium flagelliforme TaxID=2675880 RepID=A0A395M6I4_9HYPO|nr:heterokaryon incompatibility protein [Fusarium flagelliforme]